MKILYYNWAPFDDMDNGGGVAVYQRNLINNLTVNSEMSLYFLSSGLAYDGTKRKAYIEPTPNVLGQKCHSFQIVNSPVMSPAIMMFHKISVYLNDDELYYAMKDFIISQGGFDVIHYNNLEGLSLKVLSLKKDFPETKFVYSFHNYFPICPQVNLWKENKCNCLNYEEGTSCLTCIGSCDSDGIRRKREVQYKLRELHLSGLIPVIKKVLNIKRIILKEQSFDDSILPGKDSNCHSVNAENAAQYSCYRNQNVNSLNSYFDVILAVSKRVKDIAVSYGIDEKIIHVDYIGTKVADKQYTHSRVNHNNGVFHICYMGYMREDKGFYFLLKSLEDFPCQYSSQIGVTFATKISDEAVLQRVERLNEKFRFIKIVNGYQHSMLGEILESVHLGIVPVLWEDNLPQVAIEMVANGVPILASDMGGASELTKSDLFCFHGGDQEDFYRKTIYLLNNRSKLQQFWDDHSPLTTMDKHVDNLIKYYCGVMDE